ncbi:MAG: transporter [Chloroflexi bacterium]|nr:transporter [Chloroflexota bacterium]
MITKPAAALAVAMVALTTDMLVYGLAVPVLPTIAHNLGASSAAIGVLFASYAAAQLIATPVVGIWIDRTGPRTPLLAGLVGLAASTLLFAFGQGFAMLLLARLLQGVAASVSWTACLVLIAATQPPETRGRAMGLALSSVGVGLLVGPVLGGFLFDRWGYRAPFLFAAALAAADGVARWVLVRDFPAPTQRVAIGTLLRHPQAPFVVVLTIIGAAIFAYFEPILPVHLTRDLGERPSVIGLVFGAAVLAETLVAPFSGMLADRAARIIVVAAGIATGTVGMVALGPLENVWLIGVSLAVIAIAVSLIMAPTLTLVASIAEAQAPPAYGGAYALYNLAYAVGLTIGPLLGGVVYGAVSFRGAAWICATTLALAGLGAGAVYQRTGAGMARVE